MNFPFDKQRIGDMADILDLKFSFERKPEFQGHKEESARELYNWLRDQERTVSEPTMADFHAQQAEWSQATFGPDSERGPLGPMKHLAREVLTEMLGIPRDEVTALLRRAEGGDGLKDVIEHADLQFLVFDAARRAGFTFKDLLEACFKKLAINKSREWGPRSADQPVEHVRNTGATDPQSEKNLMYFVYHSEVAFGGELEHGSGCEEFAAPGLAQEFIDQQTAIHGDSITFKTILGESIILVPTSPTAEPDQPTASQSPEGDPAAAGHPG